MNGSQWNDLQTSTHLFFCFYSEYCLHGLTFCLLFLVVSNGLFQLFMFTFPQCLEKIPSVLQTVKKNALQHRQCGDSQITTYQRALTAVACVEETATRCLRFRSTCEFTPERNRTAAPCVGNSSPRKGNSKVTIKFTQERNHFPVRTVGRASPTRGPWTDIVSRTQERGPTTAPCATGASTSPAAWGNTRKST